VLPGCRCSFRYSINLQHSIVIGGSGGMQGSHHRQPTIKKAEGGLPTLIAAKK